MRIGVFVAIAMLVLGAASAKGITFDASAVTTADWRCSNPHTARVNFLFFVTVEDAEPAWFHDVIDWWTFAYKDCNLSVAHQIYQNFNSFEIEGGNSVAGTHNVVMA